MKIALDGFELGRGIKGVGQGTKGVGRVIQHLLLPLVDFFPEDKFLICTKEDVGISSSVRVEQRVLPGRGGYLRWQNGPLHKALKVADPDLFIAPNYLLPLRCPWKSVLIMHDISVIAHPEWYPRKYAFTRRYVVRRSLERAGLVIVPSAFVGKEIQAFFEIGSSRIKHIGWGVEDGFRRVPERDVRRWQEGKGLAGKKVVGFLGSIFRRRHVPELIRAVGLLRGEFPNLVLHLVGRDFGVLSRGSALAPGMPDWVLWDTSISEEELAFYYSSIDAFAFLSEYEGFGFPPLEALACGTPSVLLGGSSLGEVFSGLAIMVDAPEPGAIAAALRLVLIDEAKRAELLNEFDRQRERFSWSGAAGKLAASIRGMWPG
jgi:glycosyltransferase involved in cell wall biosynthesis